MYFLNINFWNITCWWFYSHQPIDYSTYNFPLFLWMPSNNHMSQLLQIYIFALFWYVFVNSKIFIVNMNTLIWPFLWLLSHVRPRVLQAVCYCLPRASAPAPSGGCRCPPTTTRTSSSSERQDPSLGPPAPRTLHQCPSAHTTSLSRCRYKNNWDMLK